MSGTYCFGLITFEAHFVSPPKIISLVNPDSNILTEVGTVKVRTGYILQNYENMNRHGKWKMLHVVVLKFIYHFLPKINTGGQKIEEKIFKKLFEQDVFKNETKLYQAWAHL